MMTSVVNWWCTRTNLNGIEINKTLWTIAPPPRKPLTCAFAQLSQIIIIILSQKQKSPLQEWIFWKEVN